MAAQAAAPSRKVFFINIVSTIGMVLSALLFYSTTVVSISIREPAFVPLIPGVTISLKTLVEVIPGIFVALVVHEVLHALLARLNGVTVKGFGIGVVAGVIPVAFVELDDKSLLGASRHARMGILSAGVTGNLLLAVTVVALLSLIPSEPVIVAVEPGSPAEKAGLKPGMIIESINGTRVNKASEIARILAPSKKALVEVRSGTETATVILVKDGERYGIAVVDIPRPLLGMELEDALTLTRIIMFIAGINYALALINAAPLFITDGAKIVWEIMPKPLALVINVVTLFLLAANIRF